MIKESDLDKWFTYHHPTKEHLARYEVIRKAGREFASTILLMTGPASPDQTMAIRRVREAVATANAAIALLEFED